MPDDSVPPCVSIPEERFRSLEDGVIALHDALTMLPDFFGREVLTCIQNRLERIVTEVRADAPASEEDGED